MITKYENNLLYRNGYPVVNYVLDLMILNGGGGGHLQKKQKN
jgi:hypothetical protein